MTWLPLLEGLFPYCPRKLLCAWVNLGNQTPPTPHSPLKNFLDPSCLLLPPMFFGWAPASFHPSGIPVLVQSYMYSLMQWISDAIIRVNCKTGIYDNLSCSQVNNFSIFLFLYLFLNISCINLPGMKQKLCLVFFFNQQIETMHKKCEPSCSPKYNAS